MEHVLEFLHYSFGIILFCIAMALLLMQILEMNRLEEQAKQNLYDRYILYCIQIRD